MHQSSTQPHGQLQATTIRVGDALVTIESNPDGSSPIPSGTTSTDDLHAAPHSTAPRLRSGKAAPGPAEWKVLEARAGTLRLRGSGGCIGRPGER
ncbi:MAG: hypothetical protein ACKO0W_10480 [Planctomycetota bacterium]